ncbi:hypothetical protein QQ045_033340 [Rhodiola kirilowii]
MARFRNLKRLSLHCSPPFDLAGTLDQIADSGLDLEFLSITSCCDRIDPFPREPLIRISSNMPNLRSMCCRYLARDDDDMIALAEIFPELEDLDLSCCSINMSEEGVEIALTMFRKLRRIDLRCNEHHLSKAWLFSIANCPLLEEVECIFSGGYERTDIGVCAVLCGCPKLRYVLDEDIRLDMINFPLFMAVVYEAKNLRYLVINDVTMVDKEYRGDREVSAAQIRKAFVSAL